MTQLVNDAALVQRAVAGDREAFGQLFTRHGATVIRWAARIVLIREDAKDVAQEVFLRVFRALPEYRGESTFTVWLYRITYHLSLDWRDRRLRRREAPEDGAADLADAAAGPEELRINSVQAATMQAALCRLSDRDRIVLRLFYWRECTYEEISVILGVPVNTVRTHLHRAKARLRNILSSPATTNRS